MIMHRENNFKYKEYDVKITKFYDAIHIHVSNEGGMHYTEIPLTCRKIPDILRDMKSAVDSAVIYFEHSRTRRF